MNQPLIHDQCINVTVTVWLKRQLSSTWLMPIATIIMVTHEMDMAAYAKRTVQFVDGVIDSDQRNPEMN